jgi:Mg-chelatase subunit ChlD
MRVTPNNETPENEKQNINEIHKAFQQKWDTKVNKDVVKDLNEVLKNPESLKPPFDIWMETRRGYKRNELDLLRKGYEKNMAWRSFLQRFSQHPYYRQILQQENPLLTISDVLGNLIKKINEMMGGSGGSSGRNPDEEEQAFTQIIKYGKNLLDLLDDETLQEFLQPGSTQGNDDDDQNQNDSDSDENEQENQDSQPMDDKPQGFDHSKAVEQILKSWEAPEITTMELCLDLDMSMKLKKSGLESPSEYPEDGIDVRGMRSLAEVTRALPSQMALPEDVFYQRVARQELLIKEWTTKKERKNILYFLVDKSGSMGNLGYEYGGHYSRIQWAASVAIAYLRNMVANGDIFAFRFFDDLPGPLYIVTTPKEGGKLISHIFNYAGNSGGTDIQKALEQAIHDIATKKDVRIEKADIMLVSDGECGIDGAKLKLQLADARINLHTVIVGGGRPYSGVSLQDISKNYLTVRNDAGFYRLATLFNK